VTVSSNVSSVNATVLIIHSSGSGVPSYTLGGITRGWRGTFPGTLG
jgi:hypothetical protein